MCNRLLNRAEENIALCNEVVPEIADHNAYMDTMQQLVSTYEVMGNNEEVLRV